MKFPRLRSEKRPRGRRGTVLSANSTPLYPPPPTRWVPYNVTALKPGEAPPNVPDREAEAE